MRAQVIQLSLLEKGIQMKKITGLNKYSIKGNKTEISLLIWRFESHLYTFLVEERG